MFITETSTQYTCEWCGITAGGYHYSSNESTVTVIKKLNEENRVKIEACEAKHVENLCPHFRIGERVFDDEHIVGIIIKFNSEQSLPSCKALVERESGARSWMNLYMCTCTNRVRNALCRVREE